MGLETYVQKRHFSRTPEPRGGQPRRTAGPPSFVIQKHDARRLHYDFRLELDGVLLSWAVPKGPSRDPKQRRLAARTEDHPLEYGGFEGVIPEGEYGGGTVLVWDRGTWTPTGDPREGLRRGKLEFELEGEKLRGGWRLVRLPPRAADRGKESWLLMKRRDAHAVEGEAELPGDAEPLSVLTGRDLDAIASAPQRVWRSNRGGGPAGEREATDEDARSSAAARRKRAARTSAKDAPPADAPVEAAVALDDIPGARAGELPTEPRPQLATLAEAPPDGDAWLHEVKLDGYRLLARKDGDAVRLLTRRGQDWTARFPGVAAEVRRLRCEAALLDGEVVVLDARGVSDFQRLQRALATGGDPRTMRYVAFDLLHQDGRDLEGAPLHARKEALRALLGARPRSSPIRFGDALPGQGKEVLAQACQLGLEGIVSKRADSPYCAGRRTRTWLKVKCFLRQELVVVGWSEGEGSRVGFGSLLLGLPAEEPLRQTKTKTKSAPSGWILAGRVGTGFDDAELRAMRARLEPLRRDTPTVDHPPRGAEARGLRWVEPRIVVEVAFTGWTDDGQVRQASFRGVREDVRPEDVRRELVTPVRESGARRPPRKGTAVERVGGVRVTHPDRVIFPEAGVTKVDLLRYYEQVAGRMLPHAARRPLTLIRCPGGRQQRCFYQKHARPSLPDTLTRVPIEEDGVMQDYLALSDETSLLTLVQHGVVEFHLWGCRADRLDRPDRLVIDLDPGPRLGWDAVVWSARVVRERLDDLGLRSFVLSTGGNGLHVVLPIQRTQAWPAVKTFAADLAASLSRAFPRVFTDKLKKQGREALIFVDYLRNDFQSSAVSPYSVRARPGGPVSVPLSWEELDPDAPPRFTVKDGETIASREDPWADYFDVQQSLTKQRLQAVKAKVVVRGARVGVSSKAARGRSSAR